MSYRFNPARAAAVALAPFAHVAQLRFPLDDLMPDMLGRPIFVGTK